MIVFPIKVNFLSRALELRQPQHGDAKIFPDAEPFIKVSTIMNAKIIATLLSSACILGVCQPAPTAVPSTSAPPGKTYRNPILPDEMADPHVIRVDGKGPPGPDLHDERL